MKENEEITKNLVLGGSSDLMDMHQKAGSSVYLLYTDERGGKLANQGRQSLATPPEPDLGKSHWCRALESLPCVFVTVLVL